MKKNHLKKGFTLIEIAIYMAILSIFILVLTDILVAIFNTQLSTQSTSSVAQDGRYIYSRLIYDINRADFVTLPASLGDVTNSLQASISGTLITYSLASPSGNLQINDGAGTYDLNSPDDKISSIQFKRIGNVGGKNTFQINFTVTSRIKLNGKYDSEDFQTTAGLR